MNKEKEQATLRWYVCMFYPWLVSELFDIEGVLGWGPGFREWEGDDEFPPPLPDAPARYQKFRRILDQVPMSTLLEEFMDAANSTKRRALEKLVRAGLMTPARLEGKLQDQQRPGVRCLALALKAREARRPDIINLLYGRIAEKHSQYMLGGARMYLYQWRDYQNYNLAVAGLIWMLHNPITPEKVAMVIRRYCTHTPQRGSKVVVPEMLPVFAEQPQKVVVQELCRV